MPSIVRLEQSRGIFLCHGRHLPSRKAPKRRQQQHRHAPPSLSKKVVDAVDGANVAAAALSSSSPSAGDVLDVALPPRLSLSIAEPCFDVSLTYDAAGGPLDGAERVIARVGVAAWQWTRDIELTRRRRGSEGEENGGSDDGGGGDDGGGKGKQQQQRQLWSGSVSVPASRLAAPGHLDFQAAFFSPPCAASRDERWDNRGGLNFAVAADVAPAPPPPSSHNHHHHHHHHHHDGGRPRGLARAPPPAESARLSASLLLRLDALLASSASASASAANRHGASPPPLLPPGSAPLPRALARAGDGPLLSAYERCRSWSDDAAVAAELARAAGLRVGPGGGGVSNDNGNGNRPLSVVHVASEAANFAKVGGLADVVSALARAHQSSGTHVELVLPKYDCGDYGSLSELRELGRMSVPWGDGGGNDHHHHHRGRRRRRIRTAVWGALCSGLPTYLLEPLEPLPPSPNSNNTSLPPAFWRGSAYGAADDAERFLFFSAAALEFLLWAGRSPDVLHCHDWQAASIPLLLEAGGYRRMRSATFGGALGLPAEEEEEEGSSNRSDNDFFGNGDASSSSSSSTAAPLATTGTVLTIHNLAFPGRVNPSLLSPSVSGVLPWDPSSPEAPQWVSDAALDREGPRGLHGGFDALLLRAGVALADATTTVSPTYATEVLSSSENHNNSNANGGGAGPGMKSALRDAASKGRFSGVLNGIDVESYDPATDIALPARFSVDATSSSTSSSSSSSSSSFVHPPSVGKAICKRSLYEELGLTPPPDTGDGRPAPLVAVVSRLTEQKGLDLIEAGVDAAAAAGAAVVVVGTASTPQDALRFEERARSAPPNVRYVFRFDEGLARRTYAAADLLLHPSKWEPCGLAQLVALRYGCVPLVRRTGGLSCTCKDVAADEWDSPEHARNAFVFEGMRPEDAREAVERAVKVYCQSEGGGGGSENDSNNKNDDDENSDAFSRHWWHRELVPRCMRQEWSWARSAREYGELYRRVAGVRL